jgi:hydrogenase maturation factor
MLPVGKLDPELLSELLGREAGDASVVVGPGLGRDVAVIDPGGDRYLLLTADPITFATDEIGFYAVSVNVNDVATAGGTPRWFLATVLLPGGDATPELARSIHHQLVEACRRHGVALVGGHTEVTHGLVQPVIAGALVGEVEKHRLVRNDGARPGDRVLLTRGVAVEGTSVLARELSGRLRKEGLPETFLVACARLLHAPGIDVRDAAQAAQGAARVHAMHDPTEGGVATALWELAEASRVDLDVDSRSIPVLPETQRLCDHLALDPLGLIASGSLLVTVAAGDAVGVIAAWEEAHLPCADIGEVRERAGSEARVFDRGRQGLLPRFAQDELVRALG